jgi:hypothetical protein
MLVGGVVCLMLGITFLKDWFGNKGMIIAALGMWLLILGFFRGRSRLICPRCQKPLLAIGVDVTHCSKCGAPYFEEAGSDEAGGRSDP